MSEIEETAADGLDHPADAPKIDESPEAQERQAALEKLFAFDTRKYTVPVDASQDPRKPKVAEYVLMLPDTPEKWLQFLLDRESLLLTEVK